jgi:hypothetical protein
MMIARILRLTLPAVVIAALAVPPAHADIYTWVDPSGTINVSNLQPPEGAKVTNVVRERPPEALSREDAAREAARLAETQALADRVRQLEEEIALALRPPPPVDYRPAPAPTVVQYFIVEASPPVVDYPVNQPAPVASWCDPTWFGCGFTPGFYPASVIVLPANNGRRVRPPSHAPGFGPHAPSRPSLAPPLTTPIVQPLLPALTPSGLRRG